MTDQKPLFRISFPLLISLNFVFCSFGKQTRNFSFLAPYIRFNPYYTKNALNKPFISLSQYRRDEGRSCRLLYTSRNEKISRSCASRDKYSHDSGDADHSEDIQFEARKIESSLTKGETKFSSLKQELRDKGVTADDCFTPRDLIEKLAKARLYGASYVTEKTQNSRDITVGKSKSLDFEPPKNSERFPGQTNKSAVDYIKEKQRLNDFISKEGPKAIEVLKNDLKNRGIDFKDCKNSDEIVGKLAYSRVFGVKADVEKLETDKDAPDNKLRKSRKKVGNKKIYDENDNYSDGPMKSAMPPLAQMLNSLRSNDSDDKSWEENDGFSRFFTTHISIHIPGWGDDDDDGDDGNDGDGGEPPAKKIAFRTSEKSKIPTDFRN